MRRFDQVQEQALELGRRNADAIELVRKHCANARVEHDPLGGIGMLEQMTGLPIGMKTVKCEYAPKPPDFSGAEFLPVALSFYKNNCVDCPYRIPVGIPNLTTVAKEIEQEEVEKAARHEREQERQREEREERHRTRIRRVMNEPQTSRDLIGLINLIDSEDRPSGPGEELVATVKGAPHFVTRPVADVLLEEAAEGLSEHVLEAVRLAAEADQIPPDEALRVSVDALSDGPFDQAIRTLARFRAGLTPELLAPAHRWLIYMAGRHFGPSFDYWPTDRSTRRRAEWQAAFGLLVEIDLAGVLTTIAAMLEADEEYERERSAAAVETLVELRPEIAPVVSQQLVAALAKSEGEDRFGLEQRASEAITAALSRCLWHQPRETSQAMETGAPALDEDQRYSLFRAYDSVIRHQGYGVEVPAEAGAVVVEACLKHTHGDWGEETQRAAYDLLELISKWQGQLLDEHPQALFSLLLEAISKKSPETPPPERLNDPTWFFEKMSADSRRHSRIRDIRETIGGVAGRRPQDVLDVLKTFLAEDQLQTDEATEMRAECTWLLGFVGKRSDFLPEVLPLLYKGLVHREQHVRAWAIDGLVEIAEVHPADAIPVEFSATIPALLLDEYVIVQKAMLRALTRGVPVREEHALSVLVPLVQLADYYAKTGSDSDALDDAIRGIKIVGSRESDPARQFGVNQLIARLARNLDDYDLKYFLEWGSYSMLEVPEYAAALVDALQRPQIVHEPNAGDSRLREILFRVPPRFLSPHLAELRAAALANLPLHPWGALEYVEVLQRLGLWDEAVKLADDVVAAVPTSVDEAPRRTYAERVRAWARVEAAIASDAPDRNERIEQALEASRAYRRARESAKTEFPWPG